MINSWRNILYGGVRINNFLTSLHLVFLNFIAKLFQNENNVDKIYFMLILASI